MSKTFSAGIQTELAKQFASEPLIVIEIDWGVGTRYYSDRAFGLATGTLMEFSDLTTLVKLSGSGSSLTATAKLSDADGFIKDVMGQVDIHKRPAKVYLAFGDLDLSDMHLLLNGEINSPVEWDDRARTFKFDIVSKIETAQIGFSPEQADLDYVDEQAIGKAWPLCFGSPLHVPAAKITEQTQGSALFQYRVLSPALTEQICSLAKQQRQYQLIKETADNPTTVLVTEGNYAQIVEALTSATTSLTAAKESACSDGDNVRRGLINNLIAICGDVREAELARDFASGNYSVFTSEVEAAEAAITDLQTQLAAATDAAEIAAINASIAEAEAAKAASEIAQAQALADTATASANVSTYETQAQAIEQSILTPNLPEIVIKNGDKFPQGETVKIIINKMMFVGTFSGETFTVNEAGLQIIDPLNEVADYSGSIATSGTEFAYGSDIKGMYGWLGSGLIYITNWVNGIAVYSPEIYNQAGEATLGGESRKIWNPANLSGPGFLSPVVKPEWIQVLRNLDSSGAKPGYASGLTNLQAQEFSINYGDPVFLDGDFQEKYVANLIESTEIHEVLAYRNIDGVETLVPVPSSYYVIDLAEDIAGQTATTITLRQPLSSYTDEEWSSGLYVSLTSSVGPNTATIMKWLIDTYGEALTSNTASFTALATALANYPSHFALLEQMDLLQAIEEIAWQARCAAYVRNDEVYVTYLASEPTSVLTIDSSNTDFESLMLTLSETEDLVTVFTANWRRELSQDEPSEVVIRNNIPKYGTLKESFDFYIYNVESLVVKSATFWSIRRSNTWKRAKLVARLNTFQLDEFDAVTLDFGDNIFGSSAVKGIVDSIVYDSAEYELTYEIWLPIRSGELVPYTFAWPASSDPGDAYPTDNDLYAGS